MTGILMYDGINALAAAIAAEFPDAQKVAGYVSGPYAWSDADWGLFPRADHVRIATSASVNDGDVLDVEAGDATPGQSAGWIAMRKAAGLWRPTIYCSRSVVPAVRAGTGRYVLGTDYDLWDADYDNSPVTDYPLAVAKQYRSTTGYDVSMVYDKDWPHRKPPVTPGLPAPADLSVTAWQTLHVSFPPVTGAKGYTVQVRQPDGQVLSLPTAITHEQTPLIPAGPCEVRARAVDAAGHGGQWTDWRTAG